MNLVACNDQLANWSSGICTINCDAKAVGSVFPRRPAFEILLNVVDVIFEDLDVGAATEHADSPRNASVVARAIVANLETLDPDIADVPHHHHAGVALTRR